MRKIKGRNTIYVNTKEGCDALGSLLTDMGIKHTCTFSNVWKVKTSTCLLTKRQLTDYLNAERLYSVC